MFFSGQIEPHIFDQNAQVEATGVGAYVPGILFSRSETSLKYKHL